MRIIDLYFKKFNEYKKTLLENPDSIRMRRVIKRANLKEDSLTITKYKVEIETDWITNIEKGLEYIEKAINEERQFIRTEGEVVRIEKVKKTSKESVEHLSRNSNLITKVPKKGDPLIPDSLYVVENLSDFAVYENRFLLMLLLYLQEFIYFRLETIKEKLTTYYSKMHINKEIKVQNRIITYELNTEDVYKNEPYLQSLYEEDETVKRVETIYHWVGVLLESRLMKEVSKAAPLTPPIVKTNVLRMNPNFRAAMELYDYMMSYDKLGYKIEEIIKHYNPLKDDLSEDLALTIELQTFIFYKYGNEIKDDLIDRFNEEEKRLKLEQEKLKQQELLKIEKKVKQSKKGYEEYILLLEERNKELELKNQERKRLIEENKKLKEEYDHLKNTLEEEQQQVLLLQKEIENLNEIILINSQKHLNELNELEESLKESFRLEKESINAEHQLQYESFKKTETDLKEVIKEHESEILIFNEKLDEMIEHNKILTGENLGLKQQKRLLGEDDVYTSEERFKELELIMKSFNRFFKNQWKDTKRNIRKKVKEESDSIYEEELKERQERRNK